MITKASAPVERLVRSYFTEGPAVDGFDQVEDQDRFLHHVAWSATQEMRAHVVEYVARRGQTGEAREVKRDGGRRALRLAVPIWLESRYPTHDPARKGRPTNLRLSAREGGMPTERLLQLRHELRIDQFTHGERRLNTLPPTNAFASRPGPYAIGKRETPVETLDWLEAAHEAELASVRLLSKLDWKQWGDLNQLARFSSGRDRPEEMSWSSYAHVAQEERARGGLAAYLISRAPQVAPVRDSLKVLAGEFHRYAHATSVTRLALQDENERLEVRTERRAEVLGNAKGYGVLRFEENTAARRIAVVDKLIARHETRASELRDALARPFERAEELRQATRGLDLEKLARASAGVAFATGPHAPSPDALREQVMSLR